MKKRLSFVLAMLAGAAVAPGRALAQSSQTDENQELREIIKQMRDQMKEMRAEIDELKAAKAQTPPAQPTTAPTPPAPSAQKETSIESTQPPAQGPTSAEVGAETASHQEFAEDKVAAARFNNVPLDPKYSGFFQLPGTQTILKIGGYFKSDFIHDLKPAGNTAAFVPSSFPVPQVPGVYNSNVSIQPTRFNLDFRILNTRAGDVRFYVENDFFGTNATTPRLRHAYAQVENFLVGQTFTNFMDPDGFPDTLDFQGPNGMVNLRNPQFRYGFALSSSTTLYFSVEKASSDVLFTTPQFTSQPNSPVPDTTVRIRQESERGHFQVSGIFRDIAAFLPNGSTGTVFGWGINTSFGVRIVGKDNVIFAVAAGHGISRYIQDTSGLGIDAEPTLVPTPHLEATPAVGVEGSYQHYWRKKLRSSAVYSYAGVSNTAFAPGTTYNHATYTAANLIWNPVGSLNMVAEFLYGWKMLQNGGKANDPRIQFSAKYSFVKVDPD